MSTQHNIFLKIYQLFGWDQSVSKKFPMLASPRLCLGIFFQICGCGLFFKSTFIVSFRFQFLSLFPAKTFFSDKTINGFSSTQKTIIMPTTLIGWGLEIWSKDVGPRLSAVYPSDFEFCRDFKLNPVVYRYRLVTPSINRECFHSGGSSWPQMMSCRGKPITQVCSSTKKVDKVEYLTYIGSSSN
jgi:hypothetical protein